MKKTKIANNRKPSTQHTFMKYLTSFGHSFNNLLTAEGKIQILIFECTYSPDLLSAFHVRCCAVPICYLFHCSIKFCNIKLYANSYKIMQLEVETSCVHHFKYVRSWKTVAHASSVSVLISSFLEYSGMDQYLLQDTRNNSWASWSCTAYDQSFLFSKSQLW